MVRAGRNTHLIGNHRHAMWLGLGLMGAGLWLIHDAGPGRGRSLPWPVKVVTPL